MEISIECPQINSDFAMTMFHWGLFIYYVIGDGGGGVGVGCWGGGSYLFITILHGGQLNLVKYYIGFSQNDYSNKEEEEEFQS